MTLNFIFLYRNKKNQFFNWIMFIQILRKEYVYFLLKFSNENYEFKEMKTFRMNKNINDIFEFSIN